MITKFKEKPFARLHCDGTEVQLSWRLTIPCLTPRLARATRRAWRYALPSAARSGWAHQRVTPIQSFSWHVPRHSEEKISSDLPWLAQLWPFPRNYSNRNVLAPCSMFDCNGVLNARNLIKASRLFSKFGEKWRAGLLKLNDCDFFHSQHWEIFPALRGRVTKEIFGIEVVIVYARTAHPASAAMQSFSAN